MIIAIDGPSGAGKSTVAKAVAKKLGFSCLDTGAMYRSVAWLALEEGIALDDAEALGKLANDADIVFSHDEGDPTAKSVFINGAVSPVSATPSVRDAMLIQQQKIGRAGNYVIEGRDIGTVVFPDAELKIFLTASDEERAHRRVRQNVDRGFGDIDYEEVLSDLIRRDDCDSNREVAPLKAAEDAHTLDSTDMYIEEVIDTICAMAKERI